MEVVVSAAESDTSRVARLTAENAELRQQIRKRPVWAVLRSGQPLISSV
jgi:hypothetical protein